MAKKFALQDKLGSLCHSAWARRALSVTLFGAINGGHCEPAGMGELMEWARIRAYISGTVDQELLLRNEYLAAENQILRDSVFGTRSSFVVLELQDRSLSELPLIGSLRVMRNHAG